MMPSASLRRAGVPPTTVQRRARSTATLLIAFGLCLATARAQEYGTPDLGEPGDAMIQAYLADHADRIHATFLQEIESLDDWQSLREQYLEQYFYMLGLDPMPARSPLQATTTGTLQGDGFVVDMLHYQSRPGLYVTGNLYRPSAAKPGQRLPAVLYVCGHSYQGRSGNKTAYQSHGIWFARHGYVCLMLDTLQLGEIEAIHHGTYRENRWWWHSRGYTPAGVECLNGIRGIDYLVGREDVDPDRIAVTGISGGGAATFWIAAADPRVRVAVPVSGMADLPSYVNHRVINGHCDCMFLVNTFQWPWTRIAALIAPRPLLFTNSDQDRIFPMDANDRVIQRLERVYSLYGHSDDVDAMVSIGGHAYREDLRRAAFRFINTHLCDDPRPIEDSEVDLVTGPRSDREYPIPIERLRVFPSDTDLPADALNTTIDRHFVPVAAVSPPDADGFAEWKAGLLAELKRVSFRSFPARIPPARLAGGDASETMRLATEPGIVIPLKCILPAPDNARRILLVVQATDADTSGRATTPPEADAWDAVYVCPPRGIGPTRWTRKNPPNYVERAHALLGRTVDTGRVWDLIAAARFLRTRHGRPATLCVAGEGAAGVLAAYAALWEPEIDEVIVDTPPRSHRDDAAPQLLNVLRVCDIPEVLGMLAPRRLTIRGQADPAWDKTAAIYTAAGSAERFVPPSR
jgi:dienelactone hydrolase